MHKANDELERAHRVTRRHLFLLAAVGLLLLILGSAHLCLDKLEIKNFDGDYAGAVGTGASIPQGTVNDPLVRVTAHSKGEEFCDFSGQEDWNVTETLARDGPQSWVVVVVGGKGGYATGAFDCIFGLGHSLNWFWEHKWRNVHGDNDDESGLVSEPHDH